ncbi:hypothetical protein NPIL_478191 [Nephila pilipes]|uniref:Uncharacterized protein n=1 Tax=Nephila pilipes TaxID=299642 RepID=A0A8X6Q698_NEPPI|nr:hypothetical protein NPIL_478191 [Nephila pilipes]
MEDYRTHFRYNMIVYSYSKPQKNAETMSEGFRELTIKYPEVLNKAAFDKLFPYNKEVPEEKSPVIELFYPLRMITTTRENCEYICRQEYQRNHLQLRGFRYFLSLSTVTIAFFLD